MENELEIPVTTIIPMELLRLFEEFENFQMAANEKEETSVPESPVTNQEIMALIDSTVQRRLEEEEEKKKRQEAIDKLKGKVLKRKIRDPETGKVLIKSHTTLDEETAGLIVDKEIKEYKVREKLTKEKVKNFFKSFGRAALGVAVPAGAFIALIGTMGFALPAWLPVAGAACSVGELGIKMSGNAKEFSSSFKNLQTGVKMGA